MSTPKGKVSPPVNAFESLTYSSGQNRGNILGKGYFLTLANNFSFGVVPGGEMLSVRAGSPEPGVKIATGL